jgi:competence protein ComEA
MGEVKINLNTATVEELMQLPGIGPVLARRVVTYREAVHPYREPREITAVSGIGDKSYEAVAHRLTAAPSTADQGGTDGGPAGQTEESDSVSQSPVAREGAHPEGETETDEKAAPEPSESEVEAIPPGESLSEEELPLGKEAWEERAEEEAGDQRKARAGSGPATEEESEPEESESEIEAVPPGESVSEEELPLEKESWEERTGQTAPNGDETAEEAGPGAARASAEYDAASHAEGEAEKGDSSAELALPPSTASAGDGTASRSPWRRLSWLWTALLGGLLGMVFTLIVFAGINGSLDVSHSPAVLGIESDVDGLAEEVEALGADLEGLHRRLETLEGLAARMNAVESELGGLRGETSALLEQTDALEREVAAASEELQLVSEDVVALQDRAERTQSFFTGLQELLNDVFSGAEGMPTPTSTPEGK